MSRIEKVQPEQATGKAKQLLDTVKAKMGMTPNMMRGLANSPASLDAYLQFSGALSTGVLSSKIRQQIALAVSQQNHCEYCLSAHSAISKALGLNADQIRDSRLGTSPDDKTNAILNLATKIVEKHGLVADEDLEAVRAAGVNDAEITEVVANTALTIFTNYFNHVSGVETDFPPVEALETVETSHRA